MAQTVNFVLVALSLAVLQVNAGLIGSCDKSIISTIMNKNADNCPANLLETVYKHSPTVVFRAFPSGLAGHAKCVIGEVQEPVNHVYDFKITAHFKNASYPTLQTTFVMVESTCGLIFKHVVAENYSTFKMAISYFDGLTLGYYGCSDDSVSLSEDFTYVVCLSVVNEDADLTTASVGQCMQHMKAVTGVTDLVEMDESACTEYLKINPPRCINEPPLYYCANNKSTPHHAPFLLLVTFLTMARIFVNRFF